MFGRRTSGQEAKSTVPRTAPPKPEIPPLRTWNISWGFCERTVQAHFAKRVDDELVFTLITDYTLHTSPIYGSIWFSTKEVVLRANGYIYVEEVTDGAQDDPGRGED